MSKVKAKSEDQPARLLRCFLCRAALFNSNIEVQDTSNQNVRCEELFGIIVYDAFSYERRFFYEQLTWSTSLFNCTAPV